MAPLTEKEWDHYSYYPPAWHSFYYYQSHLEKEDLCEPCEGYGEIDFGQFHSGSKCDHCEGTGLSNSEKREPILLHKRLKKLTHRELPVSVLKRMIGILEEYQ